MQDDAEMLLVSGSNVKAIDYPLLVVKKLERGPHF
jgi:hypothetical protein